MIKNLIIIILILGFVAIVALLDVSGVQKAFALRGQINTQKQVLLDKQELIKTVEKLNILYEENKESVDKSKVVLPSDEDIPNLIVQFEALAFEQGLVLEKIGLSEVKKEEVENFKTMSITLNLMGTYPAFKNFIMAAEENMRLMDIDSISFSYKESEGEEEQGSEIFDFNVTLNTYYK